MDYSRLRYIEPPRFNSNTSDVFNFFRRFNFFRQSHQPIWGNNVTLIMLKNLLDDNSLNFVESLPLNIQQNYDLLRGRLLDHYDKNPPLSVQWAELNKCTQRVGESVIHYCDDILNLARNMKLTPDQKLYVFINGLEKNTKLHLSMNNAPQTLADALNRAKIYQSVKKKYESSVNALYT